MDFGAITAWLGQHWYWLPVFIVAAATVFLLLRLQVLLRDRSAAEIAGLLKTDPALCAERLENNRMLGLVFRRQVLELWKLDAYMALGADDRISATIGSLEKRHLEPQDKLELYQRALSYYASAGKPEKAGQCRDRLKKFITDNKIDAVEPYASIAEEADLVYDIYIDHNTALIKKLIGRAEHTKNDVMRGITQYRIAKLAYYKGDSELMNTYLTRAGKNLKGTAYEPIISLAKEDPAILAEK